MTEQKELEYASFTARVFASLIDIILSTVALAPVFYIVSGIIQGGEEQMLRFQAVIADGMLTPDEYPQAYELVNLWIIDTSVQYFILGVVIYLFWKYKDATPGKMILRMRIVDAKTGESMGGLQSLGRLFAYVVSTLPLCLGFFWIYFDKKNQGWHDKLAGTVVIKVAKK